MSKTQYTRRVITITVKQATTWKDKIIGLIGKDTPTSLYFETRWGIHTFGLKKPIDIVILDSQDRIQVIKSHLKPNRILLWNPKYFRVVELPVDEIKRLKLHIGEKLTPQYI